MNWFWAERRPTRKRVDLAIHVLPELFGMLQRIGNRVTVSQPTNAHILLMCSNISRVYILGTDWRILHVIWLKLHPWARCKPGSFVL